MGDFNGRINEIIRAFEKYPAGDLNTRLIVRETLAAERAEGFKAGYSEGIHDACEAQRSGTAAEDPDWRGNEAAMNGTVPSLHIRRDGTVSIDARLAGKLGEWAYEYMAACMPDGPEFGLGDSLVYEMRLIQVNPDAAARKQEATP